MRYNMDFLVAALIFLIVLWHHFMKQRQYAGNKTEKTFQIFMMLGIGDILLDMVSTVVIDNSRPEFARMLYVILLLFYLCQLLIPPVLYLYTLALAGGAVEEKLSGIRCLLLLPTVVLTVLVMGNFQTGLLFSVTANGAYIRGPLYLMMYMQAVWYGLVIGGESIRNYQKLGKRKFGIIWEILFIMVSCVLLQGFYQEVLLTGFAIALCLMVLLLAFQNPYVYIDNLTGLLDMQCFQEWAEEQCRRKRDIHVAVVDLRQLKQLNTIYGVPWTDRFLKKIAGQVREFTESPYVYRISGKRILIGMYSFEEYEAVLQKLLRYFSHPIAMEGEEILFSAAICGIPYGNQLGSENLLNYVGYLTALVPRTQETLLVRGDEYVKHGFLRRKTIEAYLYRAIEEDLFEVYYQPVYSIREKRFVTAEALSRLHHPGLGPISPEIFIRIAEQNGQINEIGLQQFRKVCRMVQKCPEIMQQMKNIKYNLSPAQLLKKGYVGQLVEIIREHGLEPSFFQFEITETVATEYKEEVYEAVEVFVKDGIGLCMDDFGSGYANLNAVLKLPFQCIKMDRSMLNGIRQHKVAGEFYRNIVTILRQQGYAIVAEGVEEQEEVELLEAWGVDMIQGYYFSRPLPVEEFLKKIREAG